MSPNAGSSTGVHPGLGTRLHPHLLEWPIVYYFDLLFHVGDSAIVRNQGS